jgi:hypothetical protein
MPLHLMNSYLHEKIRSSLAGDRHTATSALHLLDITYGAEAETCVDYVKIMPSQPAKEPTDFWRYSWHVLTAPGRNVHIDATTAFFLRLCSTGKK